MMNNFIGLVAAGILFVITTSGLATFNNLRTAEVEYFLDNIVIDNTGEFTMATNIRRASEYPLHITWDYRLLGYGTEHSYCGQRGDATVSEVDGDRWGPHDLNQYMGGQDCSDANGRPVRILAVIAWADRGRTTSLTYYSDPFTAKVNAVGAPERAAR